MNSDDLVSDNELEDKMEEDVNVQLNDLDGDDFTEESHSVGNSDLPETSDSDGIQGEDFVETIESEKNETLGQSDELVGNSLFYDSVPDDSLFTVQVIPDPEQFQQNQNEEIMGINELDGIYQEAFNSGQ